MAEALISEPMSAARILLDSRSWGDVKLALAGTSTDAKGAVFELLVQHYLKLSEEHGFKNVWSTHGDVPATVLKKLRLDGRDTKGIDLIAETDFGEYVAVQCKYHQDENRALTQRECEGLVAGMTLARGGFLRGLVCTNAIEHSRNLKYEIQYLKYERWSVLDEEFFGRLHAALHGEAPKPPHASEPRPHQLEAVSAAYSELVERGRDRCRVIMACATGKTHTAFFLVERLAAKVVLIAVPNLSLADQHIQKLAPEYAALGLRAKWLAVCSDKSVGQDDDASLSMPREDLRIVNVSTDASEVASWFKQYRQAERLVVFTTYQSGDVLAKAARKAGLTFDLAIFDEAHRTAGPKNGPFAHLLHAKNVDIGKRVFMTATERFTRLGLDHLVGMNEPEWYGEKVYDLTTRQAVERKIIADYRVVILACSIKATRRLIEQRKLVRAKRWKKAATASMLATGIGLRQVMREHGLKHGLSFHSSIKRMREFEEMQQALSLDLADTYGELDVFPFSCEDSAGERRKNRGLFEASEHALASNVRVFVEGVDCPDIDLIAFADPKQSKIDIVQAVGRAIRPARDRSPKVAYVYVPVLVDETGEPSNESFRQVMTILRSLKDKDDSITDDIRVMSQESTWGDAKARLEFRVAADLEVDAKDFAKNIGTKIWEGAEGVEGLDGGRLSIEDYRALAKRRGFKFLAEAAPASSAATAPWECSRGHRWKAIYKSVNSGRGCPICAGNVRKRMEDYQALAKKRGFEFLAKEAPPNAQTKTSWRCEKGHRWEARYDAIYVGDGCPYCAGRAPKTIDDYVALGRKRGFKFLSKEVPANTQIKGSWQCEKGHRWEAPYYSIQAGRGCQRCAGNGRLTVEDYRSLAKKRGFKLLAREAPKNTGVTVQWVCRKGHLFSAAYGSIRNGRGCSHCSGRARKTIADYLALAKERGFRFLQDAAPDHTKTKAPWKCRNGHRWDAAYSDILQGHGCPLCARAQRGLKLRKTLGDYVALARKRGLEFLAEEVPAGTKITVSWRCQSGHQWDAAYSDILQGHGCPHCAGLATKTIDDYRDLAKSRGFKYLGMEAPASSKTRAPWQCSKGHRWVARYSSIFRGSGCPHCYDERRGDRGK